MNKIIEEFAVQAKKFAIEQLGHPHDPTLFSARVFQEKFAELIVKECSELTLDFKNDEHYAGWLDYRDEIKKHFGLSDD